MSRKDNIVWVVIADGGHAFALSTTLSFHDFAPVDSLMMEGPHLRDRDIGSDKPSRVFSRASSSERSAIGEHGRLAQEAQREFLRQVGDRLEECYRSGKFAHLVLVAPPRPLGDLRVALSDRVADRVIGEIIADLAHAPIPAIADHVRKSLNKDDVASNSAAASRPK